MFVINLHKSLKIFLMMNPKYIILLSYVCLTHFSSLMFSHASTESWYIRSRKGVAANVAASASSKTQPVPISTQLTTSGRASTFSYDEPQFTISDSNLRSGSFTAEEKLVAQLLNRGSLTVRPNGYMNQSTNPVHVNITYNVVQILGFVGLFFVYIMVNNAVENFVHKFLDRRKDTLIENALRVFTIPSRFDYKEC
uniref:Uncharacterized protein n=1 Tax=Schistosoma haematobium TaxID=6185 RepID=A0A094ZQI6_SCHHA